MLDRDGLSGARVPDDHHRFALGDVERESLEHVLGSERLVDVDEANHGGGAAAAVTGETREGDAKSVRGMTALARSCVTGSPCSVASVEKKTKGPVSTGPFIDTATAWVYAAKLPSARPTSPSRNRLSARSRSCRTRSRVTPSIPPISSSVCSRPPSSPKYRRSTFASRRCSVLSADSISSDRKRSIA